MGGGSWSFREYDRASETRRAEGRPTFEHDYAVRSGRKSTVHSLLDPKVKAGDTSPFAGQVMREVVITDEHPSPTPIGIVLDVTGSNYAAAKKTHSRLPELFSLLQRKGYADDPQINVSATGDVYSDRFPVQFGQFESDNRIDAQLEAMILEGAGGPGRHETYEVLAYLFARHTNLEPVTQQGRKGYLFFIGDELPYDKIRSSDMRDIVGDTLQEDVTTAEIFEELKAKYEVFFLFQEQGSYSKKEILPAWRELLGQNALTLQDPDSVCDVIAALVGVMERKVTAEEVKDDLKGAGIKSASLKDVGSALAVIGETGVSPSSNGSTVVSATGKLPTAKDPISRGGVSRV